SEGVREPRLGRQQYLHRCQEQLDDLGGVRPRRHAGCEGREVGHGGGGRGGSERTALLAQQPGRFSLDGAAAPAGAGGGSRRGRGGGEETAEIALAVVLQKAGTCYGV